MEAVGKWIECGIVLLAGRSGGVLQGKMETDFWKREEDVVVSGVLSSSSSSSCPAPCPMDLLSGKVIKIFIFIVQTQTITRVHANA